MEKKVTMSQSTLNIGFLLLMTINALNKTMTERNQNNICVMLIFFLAEVFLLEFYRPDRAQKTHRNH